jgi:hypothetical protein
VNENEGLPSYLPDYFDWSDVSSHMASHPHPSSPFHGFGLDKKLQGQLHIKTEIVDGEEVFVDIQRERENGEGEENRRLILTS